MSAGAARRVTSRGGLVARRVTSRDGDQRPGAARLAKHLLSIKYSVTVG